VSDAKPVLDSGLPSKGLLAVYWGQNVWGAGHPDAGTDEKTLSETCTAHPEYDIVVLAFATVPVGIAAALSGTYPLATMLLARGLLGEALPRLGLVAVGLAVTGIVLISLGG
jgi:hypothetical protein